MSRLTPFSRFLITLLIVGGIFFGVKQFLPQLTDKFGGKKVETEQTTNGTETRADNNDVAPTTNANSGASQSGNTAATAPANRPKFDYSPTVPNGGKLRGVVELGATGFNSFVIKVDKNKNWKLEKADYGASLVYEKMATDEDVKSGLKNYISGMLGYGVSPRDIHFVISSGAQKVDITKKIIDYLKTMGYVVNLVTAEQEGKLALKCTLPKDYEGDAYVVDIGSGNTKISWVKGAGVAAIESHGAKYFQNGVSDDQVYTDIKAKANTIPFSNRKVCFIIGGVPYKLAKQVRQGKERFTVLNAPEAYKVEDAKDKAGLNIYKGIADATNTAQFVFDWDANFTIGFLLNLPY